MTGWWRLLYKALGIYNYYPEHIPEQNIKRKQGMLQELKEIFERQKMYENKIKFDNVLLQLQLTNKTATFEQLIKKNICLL